jgi:hypothetical protein
MQAKEVFFAGKSLRVVGNGAAQHRLKDFLIDNPFETSIIL